MPAAPETSGDTAARILDAAERLFAEHGYEGTSLRRVTEEAEVNLALANYHFGSKEELFREVFRRRTRPINAERLNRLQAAEQAAGGEPLPVRELLRVLLEPVLTRVGPAARPHPFVRLLGRTMLAPPAFLEDLMRAEFDAVLDRFGAALAMALPHLPPATIFWRLRAMMGAALFSFARVAPMEKRLVALGAAETGGPLLEEMLACFEGALTAPRPGTNRAKRGRRSA